LCGEKSIIRTFDDKIFVFGTSSRYSMIIWLRANSPALTERRGEAPHSASVDIFRMMGWLITAIRAPAPVPI